MDAELAAALARAAAAEARAAAEAERAAASERARAETAVQLAAATSCAEAAQQQLAALRLELPHPPPLRLLAFGGVAAALGLAPATALGFAIDPWSLTRIDRIGESWRILKVNA